MMYIPTTTHVLPLATIRRERTLPQPGQVLAREGARVNPGDILARAQLPGRHFIIDLVRRLKVPEAQVERYVLAGQGTAVEKGEVIARRPVALGLRKHTVRAPAKGMVVSVGGGKLLFASAGATVEVRAGMIGTVAAVNSESGVVLETTGALVQGLWGSGKVEYGVLRIVGSEPDQLLPVESLDVSARGAIVVGGVADENVLRTAETILARGLIVGSMSSMLIPVARFLSYPVLLTEGFGWSGMAAPAWEVLKANDGREAMIDARPADRWTGLRPEVIVPLSPEGQPPPLPSDGRPLAEGQRVRALRPPHAGAVGTVSYVPARAQVLASGVQARCAYVDFGGEEALVPLVNLEILG